MKCQFCHQELKCCHPENDVGAYYCDNHKIDVTYLFSGSFTQPRVWQIILSQEPTQSLTLAHHENITHVKRNNIHIKIPYIMDISPETFVKSISTIINCKVFL